MYEFKDHYTHVRLLRILRKIKNRLKTFNYSMEETNDYGKVSTTILYFIIISLFILTLLISVPIFCIAMARNTYSYSTISISPSTNTSTYTYISNKSMYVLLDVFSGRPNPTWILTSEQASEFLKKISQMKSTEKNYNNQNKGLGYRGFIVEEKSNKGDVLKRFEIYDGKVKVVTNDLASTFDDNDYFLERWLLQIASHHVENNLITIIKEEIKNRLNNQ